MRKGELRERQFSLGFGIDSRGKAIRSTNKKHQRFSSGIHFFLQFISKSYTAK